MHLTHVLCKFNRRECACLTLVRSLPSSSLIRLSCVCVSVRSRYFTAATDLIKLVCLKVRAAASDPVLCCSLLTLQGFTSRCMSVKKSFINVHVYRMSMYTI